MKPWGSLAVFLVVWTLLSHTEVPAPNLVGGQTENALSCFAVWGVAYLLEMWGLRPTPDLAIRNLHQALLQGLSCYYVRATIRGI